MRQAIGPGGPALPVDETGTPLGTAENPIVVSGAPLIIATPSSAGPVTQTSTNTADPVSGSELDASRYQTVAYTFAVAIETNDVIASVWAANAEDFSDEVQLASATVPADSADSWSDTAFYRYYRVKVIDLVDGDHGDLTVRGIAKTSFGVPAATGTLTQTSTNAALPVDESDLDTDSYRTIAYTFAVATNDVVASVWGANSQDFSDEVELASGTIAAGDNDSFSDMAVYRYYRAKIVDLVDGDHGDVTVSGVAKR